MKTFRLFSCPHCGVLYDKKLDFHNCLGSPDKQVSLPPSGFACIICGEEYAPTWGVVKRANPYLTEAWCNTCQAITRIKTREVP